MRQEADPFRVLYVENRERVRRLLERIVGPQEAEDLHANGVRESGVGAAGLSRRGATFDLALPDCRQCGFRLAAQPLRARGQGYGGAPCSADDDVGEANVDTTRSRKARSPEQALIRNEMNDCIRQVIAALPDNHRAVLVLGALGGFSDDDIARTLQISRSNAKVRLHRARAELKQALDRRCDFYHNEDNELACEPKPGACGASSTQSGCSRAADSTGKPPRCNFSEPVSV